MTNRDTNQYNRLMLALCSAIVARLRRLRYPGWATLEKGLRVLLAIVSFLTLTLTVMHREDADGYQAAHLFFMPRRNWEMDHGRGMLYEPKHYGAMDEAILYEEVNGIAFTFGEEDGEYEIADLPAPQPSAEKTTAYREWMSQEQAGYTTWFVHTRASYGEWLKSRAQSFDNWIAGQPDGYRAAYAEELAAQVQAAEATGLDIEEGERASTKRTQPGTVRKAPRAPVFGSNDLPVDTTYIRVEIASWQYAAIAATYPQPSMWRDDTPTPPPRKETSP